jgi:sigma-B regulation protein RsbU (phosphoserine phosphatase)
MDAHGFEESAEELLEDAPCGYLSAAPDGTLLRVNRTFLRWTGYEREDLVGVKRFQDLLSVGGRIYHETHYAPMLRMQGIVREIAVDIVTADGRRLPVLVNSALRRDAGGEPQVVRTTIFDATERKSYERELLKARDRARDVAHTLQRSLLAGLPLRDPRFEIATLYRSAVEHLEVGGDWHDAFTLAGGRVGIVVGDVVGRGLRAASAMGQLRSAVRALAGAGMEPASVLVHLDTFVAQVDDARYATLAYAEVDPDSGGVLLAAAGHMPPVIVEPGGETRLFMEGRSPPLGAADPARPRAQARLGLSPGAGFLLYTAGLVERRTEAIDAGLDRLLDVVRAAPGASPAELVQALPAALIDLAKTTDDVCLLSFRLTASDPNRE